MDDRLLISMWCKGCGENIKRPMTKDEVAQFSRDHAPHGLVGLHQEMDVG